jgi:hypothetical protein
MNLLALRNPLEVAKTVGDLAPLISKHQTALSAIALLAVILASGCASPPLRTKSHRQRLGEIAELGDQHIEFMNYCFFEEIADPETEETLEGRRGIVAATKTEICLIDGGLNNEPTDYVFKIPFTKIDGVSGSHSQIHIKSENKVIVLFLYYWSDHGTDRKRTVELHQLLTSKGISEFKTEELYSLSRFKHPKYPHSGYSQNDLGPTNYDASLQAIQSHENRYDPWDPVRLTNESK